MQGKIETVADRISPRRFLFQNVPSARGACKSLLLNHEISARDRSANMGNWAILHSELAGQREDLNPRSGPEPDFSPW